MRGPFPLYHRYAEASKTEANTQQGTVTSQREVTTPLSMLDKERQAAEARRRRVGAGGLEAKPEVV